MTGAAIPDGLRPRLSRFVRLLASDQPGEVVAAAAALKRALAGCGADLNDLGDLVERPAEAVVYRGTEPPRKRRETRPGDVVLDREQQQRVRLAIVRALGSGSLTDWETTFTSSILAQLRDCHGRLTEKQGDALGRLLHRLGEAEAWA